MNREKENEEEEEIVIKSLGSYDYRMNEVDSQQIYKSTRWVNEEERRKQQWNGYNRMIEKNGMTRMKWLNEKEKRREWNDTKWTHVWIRNWAAMERVGRCVSFSAAHNYAWGNYLCINRCMAHRKSEYRTNWRVEMERLMNSNFTSFISHFSAFIADVPCFALCHYLLGVWIFSLLVCSICSFGSF